MFHDFLPQNLFGLFFQINIPCQTESVDLLSFFPVEEHFYRRQYGECSKDAMKVRTSFSYQLVTFLPILTVFCNK